MSLVRVQSEEPYLEKPAQGNLSGLFAFLASAADSGYSASLSLLIAGTRVAASVAASTAAAQLNSTA